MKLVVGLGNPGKEYEGTRHNTGYLIVENIAREIQNPNGENQNYSAQFKTNKKFEGEILQIDEMLLVKPQTFMNKSGEAVAKLLKFYKVGLESLWVVHDDLD